MFLLKLLFVCAAAVCFVNGQNDPNFKVIKYGWTGELTEVCRDGTWNRYVTFSGRQLSYIDDPMGSSLLRITQQMSHDNVFYMCRRSNGDVSRIVAIGLERGYTDMQVVPGSFNVQGNYVNFDIESNEPLNQYQVMYVYGPNDESYTAQVIRSSGNRHTLQAVGSGSSSAYYGRWVIYLAKFSAKTYGAHWIGSFVMESSPVQPVQPPVSVIQVYSTVSQKHIVEGTRMESLECIIQGGVPSQIIWYHNGAPILTGSSAKHYITNTLDSKSILNIYNPTQSDAGRYECRANGQSFTITVTFSSSTGGTNPGGVESISNTCDPIMLKCETHNQRRPDIEWYQAQWKCDGEDDCGNGFDEYNCPARFSRCNSKMFSCPALHFETPVSIPAGYVCDGENDCGGTNFGQSAADEQACGVPNVHRVNDMSQVQQRKRSGDSYTVTCTVSIQTAVPRIVWRLNWMCLPRFESGRNDNGNYQITETYDQSCSTVTSTLTVNRVSRDYQGIYNCEALINKHRAFSEDFTLTVE